MLALLAPRLPKLKEWAYAGFTFAWIAALVAHHLAGDGLKGLTPPGATDTTCRFVCHPASRPSVGIAYLIVSQGPIPELNFTSGGAHAESPATG